MVITDAHGTREVPAISSDKDAVRDLMDLLEKQGITFITCECGKSVNDPSWLHRIDCLFHYRESRSLAR